MLASDPQLLLFDEPTAGMSSEQVPELIEIINRVLKKGNRTAVLVEHRMDMVMSVSDSITVMAQGCLLAEGSPQEIAENVEVQKAYLGDVIWRFVMSETKNLLTVDNIQTFIGQFHILENVSIEVPQAAITVLLGRNGAGKTTTLKSILGLTPPREGKVVFDRQEIQGKKSVQYCKFGCWICS